MRYRMEVIEDELVIRNVDTDVRLGTATYYGVTGAIQSLAYFGVQRPKHRCS